MCKRPSPTVDACFGAFFVGLAFVVLIVAWDSTPVGAGVAFLVLGFLGMNAVVSACRGKPSLLSRIGPLP